MPEPRITPRNLSYDSTLPPFLQRLHQSRTTSALDGRHEVAIARPQRARDARADADDEPAYVDEDTGEVLSTEAYAALVAGEGEAKDQPGEGTTATVAEGTAVAAGAAADGGRAAREKEGEMRVAIGGALRKRKAGRVIGGGESGEEGVEREGERDARGEAGPMEGGKNAAGRGPKPGKKGKGKKIKLSFGDDEDEP